MRSPWMTRVDPKSHDECGYKRQNRRHREGHQKDRGRDAAAFRSWKSQGRSLPRALRGNVALLSPWFWTSGLQNSERIYFCSSKQPSLLPAAGNRYSLPNQASMSLDSGTSRTWDVDPIVRRPKLASNPRPSFWILV